MIVKRQKSGTSSNLYDYVLMNEEQSKFLAITFQGNLDLYFTMYNREKTDGTEFFDITKSNYTLYEMFERLYNDIMENRILKDELSESEDYNESIKYKYQGLPIVKDERVVWISDDSCETDLEKCNSLTIIKHPDTITLKFKLNDKEDFFNRSIRISNSGSRYEPYNICFMNFYNNLQTYDPNFHQVHIEEIPFQKLKRY